MNKVYSVWGSEDEGFRFPLTDENGDNCVFTSVDDAVAFARKEGAINEIDFTDKDLEYLGVPSVGWVTKVFSGEPDLTSIDVALNEYLFEPNRESLYAIDWIFIVEQNVR